MQRNAYKKRMKYYDDVLTGRRWWSHIYMKSLWRTDDNAIAREVLAMIPDDFRGKILDVPVGTAVFTAEKYRRMPDAEIVGLDYSQEMLANGFGTVESFRRHRLPHIVVIGTKKS